MASNMSNRRKFVKRGVLGLATLSTADLALARGGSSHPWNESQESVFYRYPAIDDEQVQSVVGAAHSDLEKVKELVSNKPELATATWDWGFGDFESALGAASHMARTDIASYLMNNGARPDIFTYAMMGEYEVVKSMIEAFPGIQKTRGPHGITLLQHAKNRLRRDASGSQKAKSNRLISYLEALGDADLGPQGMSMTEDEKALYLGKYRFGEEESEVLEVSLNMRKMLQIGRYGQFGSPLNKVGDARFSPSGALSVVIEFKKEGAVMKSLTIHHPNPILTATRI